MSEEQRKDELEFLREECNRLRNERDLARKERQDAELVQENESSVRLKLLSESLTREVKDRFWGTLKTGLWVATLLLGIATAGGLWKLSDIVTERVNDKIKEKEQDVAQIRQQIIKSVVDFERQAQKALEDIEKLKVQVARESDRATGEIRQAKARILAVEISAQGQRVTVSASVPEGVDVPVWFGMVGGGVAAVAGSQANRSSFEDPKTQSGAFSSRFQRALRDPRADTNQDGQISVAEAAEFTRNALKQDDLDQIPTVAGCANEIALFSVSKLKLAPEKYRAVHAIVVGINRYSQASANLRGAVNDAKGFIELLKNRECCLFGNSTVISLLDEEATVANIKNSVQALSQKATKNDLVIFYYSGHITTVGKGRDVSKVIFPTDGDFEKGDYLKISDIVESMNKIGTKNALVLIDG